MANSIVYAATCDVILVCSGRMGHPTRQPAARIHAKIPISLPQSVRYFLQRLHCKNPQFFPSSFTTKKITLNSWITYSCREKLITFVGGQEGGAWSKTHQENECDEPWEEHIGDGLISDRTTKWFLAFLNV